MGLPQFKIGNIYGEKENKRQPIAQSTKRAVIIRQNNKCALCHKPLIGSINYDHIKPVCEGGKSITANLRAICASCHDKRHILERAKKMDIKKKRGEKRQGSDVGIPTFKIPKFKTPKFKVPNFGI